MKNKSNWKLFSFKCTFLFLLHIIYKLPFHFFIKMSRIFWTCKMSRFTWKNITKWLQHTFCAFHVEFCTTTVTKQNCQNNVFKHSRTHPPQTHAIGWACCYVRQVRILKQTEQYFNSSTERWPFLWINLQMTCLELSLHVKRGLKKYLHPKNLNSVSHLRQRWFKLLRMYLYLFSCVLIHAVCASVMILRWEKV